MVEYALLAALFAVASIGSITMAGNAVTSEIETMAAGISTSATQWVETDDGPGDDGTTTTSTTTTTTTLPPTTTTTTTLPPTTTTTTTTTTVPEDEPPVIEASGSSEWKNNNHWYAIAVFGTTWDEDVKLTIEIVSTAADGTTSTEQKKLKIDDDDDDQSLTVQRKYKESDQSWKQIVSVEFRVVSIETENSNGDDVTYETSEPVVVVEVPK